MLESLELPTRDDADAKAWFYLKHRTDIETWAALRGEAARLLERYLLALVPAVAELAEEHEAGIYERDLESGAWPRFGLHRPTWQHAEVADVSVVIEWDRGRLLSGSRGWPYVGVRVSPRQKDARRRQDIANAVTDLRRTFTDSRTGTWPAWQYVTPPGGLESAVDPEALAVQVWKRLNELWVLAAPALDQLHFASAVSKTPAAQDQNAKGS